MMLQGYFKPYSFWVKCFLLLGILVVTTSLGFFVYQLIYIVLFSSDQSAFSLENLKILQFVQAFSTFVVPSFIAAYLFSPSAIHYLHLDRKISIQILLLSVLTYFCFLPALQAICNWNEQIHLPEALSGVENYLRQMEESNKAIVENLLTINGWEELIGVLFLAAVMPGIGEELLFRGVLQRLFQDRFKNVHIAVWITAFIFSTIHFQFFGFVPRLLLGAFFGYLFVWSGSIYLPMLMHMINNAGSILFDYFNKNGAIQGESFEKIGSDPSSYLYVAVSLIFTVVAIIYLKRISAKTPLSA